MEEVEIVDRGFRDMPTGKNFSCGKRWKTEVEDGSKIGSEAADASVRAGDRTTRVSFTACGRLWTAMTQGVEPSNDTGVTLDIGVRSNPNTTSSGHP